MSWSIIWYHIRTAMNVSHHSVKNWGLVATIVPSINPTGLEVDEVAVMNTSAIDLHILMTSKIIIITCWWYEMLEEVIVFWNGDFGKNITAPGHCLWTKHQVEGGWEGYIGEVVAHCFWSGKDTKQMIRIDYFVNNLWIYPNIFALPPAGIGF